MLNKSKQVYDIFSSVASKYDLMNNIMSFGSHHLWKRHLVNLLINTDARLLDVASGSGDVAFAFYNKVKEVYKKPKVTMCDINADMLDLAQEKATSRYIFDIDFVLSDAEKLIFEDNNFEYYTISFGIRNVVNRDAALSEAYRVLVDGGRFFCLEFSNPKGKIIKDLYELYSTYCIPFVGEVVAGNRDAYEYLVNSIKEFPDPETFKTSIENAGFVDVSYSSFSGGIVTLYSGYKFKL
ncbi:MAG: bifunctional demethylmenaquinone methyltransferase/2-methoxy-6-polyprenyl-1,4-benzoquinol methylase UbiE [Rickettsiaceae bacterium]|nr:bifunctional demethylmenaquinone methyltransferase/2-methoxy-6-polyprenyl-1,4-benzoquinol methylase UbiE [Rickettsiaceae bacterium]